jgi:hypothetical protein
MSDKTANFDAVFAWVWSHKNESANGFEGEIAQISKDYLSPNPYYVVFPANFVSKAAKGADAVSGTVGGSDCVFGYLQKESDLETGESRLYSTDKDGKIQAQITLRSDGKIEILQTDGAQITVYKGGKIEIATDESLEISAKSVSIGGKDNSESVEI